MKIVNHLLYDDNDQPVLFKPTPNKGGSFKPQYIVMHNTAATKAAGSIDWFLSPASKASAHLLIDRDGSVVQFAPFNVITWHAGASRWKGLSGLNKHAIGIELVNGSRLKKSGRQWICPEDGHIVPEEEVIMAAHKHEREGFAWHVYAAEQLQVAVEIAKQLAATYNIRDIIGHDDIAPVRKTDPGPAFPMENFRLQVLGRKETEPHILRTATRVNIRSGPGTHFPLIAKPLPKNTVVQVLQESQTYCLVHLPGDAGFDTELEGWVYKKYLVAIGW